jgi:hypothetical protein
MKFGQNRSKISASTHNEVPASVLISNRMTCDKNAPSMKHIFDSSLQNVF